MSIHKPTRGMDGIVAVDAPMEDLSRKTQTLRGQIGALLHRFTPEASIPNPANTPTHESLALRFRFLQALRNRSVPGSYRLYNALAALGILSVAHRKQLPNDVTLDIPQQIGAYTSTTIETYEETCRTILANAIGEHMGDDVDYIDCGSDIGVVAGLLKSDCPQIKSITAFEPGPWYPWMKHNVEQLPNMKRIQALNAAVADFSGTGEMRMPEFAVGTHSLYLAQDPKGSVEVRTIDSLDMQPDRDLVIKIDVEGGEEAVVQGARDTIANAKNVVVLFEANPRQTVRSGNDPIHTTLKTLNAIRPFTATIAEAPDIPVQTDKNFFYKEDAKSGHVLLTDEVYNICAVSTEK